MIRSVFVVSFLVAFSYSETSFLDSLQKCDIKDSECLKGVSETLKDYLADNGLPEMGIAKLDPMPIVNQTVSVIGLVDLTMVEGVAEGMKSCILETFDVNMETKITKFDVFCDVLTVKGVYSIKSAPLIEKFFGSAMAGDGNGSVVMEKLKMNFTNPFEVKMKDDGEIYLTPDFENSEYSYEILDKVTFKASNITLGILQIAPSATSFMNKNWDTLMSAFGRLFSDKGMTLSYGHAKLFFESVPAKKFISNDLTPYLNLRTSGALLQNEN